MFALAFPAIDPVAIQFGPLAIRWYSLAYIAGFLGGWRYSIWLTQENQRIPTAHDFDQFLGWGVVGTIVGGRLGYVLFYNFQYYFFNPIEILMVWQGGMSFHGGMIGVITSIIIFSTRRGLPVFMIGDIIAAAAPIGLFFGRIANFINGELYGRVTDVPWAVVFPRGGLLPRHPSQLYEALLEGLVLFLLMAPLARQSRLRARPGTLTGIFLSGYGIARFIVEFFREPDAQLGFLISGATMGQLLSLPMIFAGLLLILRARKQPPIVP